MIFPFITLFEGLKKEPMWANKVTNGFSGIQFSVLIAGRLTSPITVQVNHSVPLNS